MKRRAFIAGAVSAAIAAPAVAQTASKMQTLAIFSPFEPQTLMHEKSSNRYYRALFAELRRLGHVEGRNLAIERYGKEQNTAGSGPLAAQVVHDKPDVVYVVGPGILEFKARTTTLPIVALTGDPLAQGLAKSLSHPGGNITGVSVDTGPAIYGKRIELLRELAPSISKLAFLGLRGAWDGIIGRATRAACKAATIPLVPALLDPPTSDAGYRGAVNAAKSEGAGALIVIDNPDALEHRTAIVAAAAQARLPAIYGISEFVEAGGLIAYSFDLVGLNLQAARDIDAILRGADPGGIPFFQSTKFELSINLKTAKALGLTVPRILLTRADDVVE